MLLCPNSYSDMAIRRRQHDDSVEWASVGQSMSRKCGVDRPRRFRRPPTGVERMKPVPVRCVWGHHAHAELVASRLHLIWCHDLRLLQMPSLTSHMMSQRARLRLYSFYIDEQ